MSNYGTRAPGFGSAFTEIFPAPVKRTKAPENYDRGFLVGQLWIDTTTDRVWMLTSRSGGIPHWTLISVGGTGDVQTLTGADGGGPVGPDGADNITLEGAGGLTITGNAGTNTLTFTQLPTVLSLEGNSGGTVSPDVLGVINVIGSGAINIVGAPMANTLTVSTTLEDAVLTLTGDNDDEPVPATANNIFIESEDNSGLTITGDDGTSTLTIDSAAILSLTPDSGTTPVLPNATTKTISITGGDDISVVGSSETITINYTGGGGGGFTWNLVDTDTTMVVNNGYISTAAEPHPLLTLPSTSAVGDTIKITSRIYGLWEIRLGAGQFIYLGGTGAGETEYIAATSGGDSVELVCTTEDLGWTIISCVGNINFDTIPE